MNWLTATVGVATTTLLLVQGATILARKNPPAQVVGFGALALLLGGVGLALLVLFRSNALVLSPEFGLALVQGSGMRAVLAFVLLAVSVTAGLGWHVARLGTTSASRPVALLGIGALVGLSSCTRLLPLNVGGSGGLRLYSYDLWWPVPFIWIGVSLVETGSIILLVRPTLQRWVAILFVIAAAVIALRRPLLGDPTSQPVWVGALFTSVVLALVLGAESVRDLRAALRSGTPKWGTLTRPTLRQAAVLLALVSVVASLGDLFYIGSDPGVAVCLFLVGWALLAELVAGGPLKVVCQALMRTPVPKAQSALQGTWAFVRERLGHVAAGAVAWAKVVTSAGSWPGALVTILFGIILFVALSEVPDAGKTVIQRFAVIGTSKEDNLGQSLSDQVFLHLGLLSQQLRPEAIIPERVGGTAQRVRFVTLRDELVAANAALGESHDLSIWGGLKIPLSLLFEPVRGPVRKLLRVRVISGSLVSDGSHYTLLASASTGESWAADASVVAESAAVGAADTSAFRRAGKGALSQEVGSRLARQLAFEILSSDPRFTSLGMTSSWKAFQHFAVGLDAWNTFTARKDVEPAAYDDLTHAVQEFREAARVDPGFALASYRLGAALQADGQPAAAASAFGASVHANPGFVSGYNALAYLLYFYEDYYSATAAPLEPAPIAPAPVARARSEEARRLWQQVLALGPDLASRYDKASAYNGLCRYALDRETYPQAYFYCQIARRFYTTLPRTELAGSSVPEAEAATLSTLGVALEQHRQTTDSIADREWSCSGRSVSEGGAVTAASAPRSPYGRAALRYYERALALRPGDLVLGCNAATSTYFLGDAGPLRALDSLPQAHVALADDYAGHGKGAVSLPMVAAYYRLALGEYERAIDLEPANVGALNGYGYAFWQWLLRGGHEFGPDSQMANRAVTYLRRGVVLSTAQHSEMELYARSTLGEVLLGSAHPREAEQELGYLFDHKLVPDHPLFDELRWDLAEAHLCAAAAHARAGLRSSKRAQATALFGTIRHNEANREFRPFTDRPDWLDPDRPLPLCTYHRARFP